ncbi:hypothetical protein HS088_TW06G01242 [Tripterygium wilfordii]|uniref:Uncharacterized protein n=1 Tax=Tripterygium wilfordii TaxID=458696 RepID=A0A7J7DLG1_TRIWF|nr:hypothetical protein HS088_TW06G01242 [Tripterygium wilfordii]
MAAPVLCCSNSTASTPSISKTVPPLVMKQKKRYRKLYPGETEGITEEMRFVAMRFRNVKGKYVHKSDNSSDEDEEGSMNEQNPSNKQQVMEEEEGSDEAETWFPTIEGFIKYLVDSKLVFDTIERVIDESIDVAYSYFRKTGLERSECLSKDLDWFSRQNIVIPEPSTAGVSYVKYLDELAEKSAPLFLCHFYNIYFSHIAGGQVITRQVSKKILEGRELEFCKWEGDVEESLKGVREKLNMLGEGPRLTACFDWVA